MKYFSTFTPTSKELVNQFAEKRNLVEYVKENYSYPKEDYLIASDLPPIFVVSDGVTLNFMKLVEDKMSYPNPSPKSFVSNSILSAKLSFPACINLHFSKPITKSSPCSPNCLLFFSIFK